MDYDTLSYFSIVNTGIVFGSIRSMLYGDEKFLKMYERAESAGAETGREMPEWPNGNYSFSSEMAGDILKTVRDMFAGHELTEKEIGYLCVAMSEGRLMGFLKVERLYEEGLLTHGKSVGERPSAVFNE